MASDDRINAPTATQAGTTNAQVFDIKRPFNPLSKYSSYTYQFSLYAISPEYYDLFARDKLKFDPTNPGVVLVLQSGGINSTQTRAEGFQFDYYIDDVKIENIVAPEARQTSTVSYSFEFKVYEHLGFKFISNLKLALNALKSVSPEYSKVENASRILFVMTVKFLGYDAQGNLITDTDVYGLQKNYDLIFTSIKFKLDGNMTVYQIKAVPIRTDVTGTKKGILKDGAFNLYGQTVEQVLNKLMETETNNRKLANNNNPSDVFSVEFVGPNAEKLSKATFASPADPNKNNTPATGAATTTAASNPTSEAKAVPKLNEKEIKINTGTPIQKAIEEVIKLSSYIRDPLTQVQQNDTNPNAQPVKQDNKLPVSWFNVTPRVEKVVRNQTVNDYMYKVTYVIQPYITPDVSTPYVENVPSYFGPVKVYNYYYTGQNSEVIRFEQEFDNLYFTVALDVNGVSTRASGGNAQVPVSTNVAQGGSKQGAENPAALSAQNSLITYLLDPAKVATAKIEILGDPDWLGQDVISTQRYVNENNFTINYSASQVFIEISIKEPIDYNHSTGVVDLNENIIFWDYPDYVREKLQGKISYRVIKVVSTFKNGKFTQMLDLVLTTFPNKPPQTTGNQTPAAGTNNTTGQGLLPAPTQRQSTAGTPAGTQTAPATPVSGSNDDAIINRQQQLGNISDNPAA